jgi:hypothetical protein
MRRFEIRSNDSNQRRLKQLFFQFFLAADCCGSSCLSNEHGAIMERSKRKTPVASGPDSVIDLTVGDDADEGTSIVFANFSET